MADAYNPDDYATWGAWDRENVDPDKPRTWHPEQYWLDRAVWLGLLDGDLEPLKEYLRSPYPMRRQMREDIATCIEGDDTRWKIVCKRLVAGGDSLRESVAVEVRNMRIAAFVEQRKSHWSNVKNPRDNAIADAVEKFKESPSTVIAACTKARAIREGRQPGLSFSLRGWKSKRSP